MEVTTVAATVAMASGLASLNSIALPEPSLTGPKSLEEPVAARRSVRDFSSKGLSVKDISQLLWSAQGVTGAGGLRAAPSAGALYPLEIYVVVGRVDGLEPGVYRYRPQRHRLARTGQSDVRKQIYAAALRQEPVREAAAVLVISAVFARSEVKYGKRGVRYSLLEAGHAAQNVCLQATALGLGAVPIGAFHDSRVAQILGLGQEETPLYLLPIGKPGR